MMKNFVIISEARTGGTHVMSKLNSHPNISCVSEPFAHLELNTIEKQLDWAHTFTNESNESSAGFRTKIDQIANHELFVEWLLEADIQVFYMERTNIIKRAISRQRAIQLFKESGDYNVKVDKGMNPLSKRKVDIKVLEKQIIKVEKEISNSHNFFSEHQIPNLEKIVYEDILRDEEGFFTKLQLRLGIEVIDLISSVSKNTSDKLQESIENFDELEQKFENTEYYPMLFS